MVRSVIARLSVLSLVVGVLTGVMAPTASASIGGPNDKVNAIVTLSDGSQIVGGAFTSWGGVTRNHIAKVLADGTLDSSWNPNLDGTVEALAVSGNWVYVGGWFGNVGAVSRSSLAKINVGDGSLDASWNPGTGHIVDAIAIDGSDVYIGGSFTTLGGVSRNRLGSVSTSGTVNSWNPNINSTIRTLVVADGKLFVGGDFSSASATTRNYAASFNLLSAGSSPGALTSWNPNADSTVWRIAPSGSTVYIAGDFSTVGGSARPNLAVVDGATGAVTSWDSQSNNVVRGLWLQGTTLYVGGHFTSLAGSSRNQIAAFSVASGDPSLLSWNPQATSGPTGAYAFATFGSSVYVGGNFAGVAQELTATSPSTGADYAVLNGIVTVSSGGDSSENPRDILQQLPVPATGSCADIDDEDFQWGTGLHHGWHLAWGEWLNAPVCSRTLHYSNGAWGLAA